MSDPAIIAAADQAHAEAEETLTSLIDWWAEIRTQYNWDKADEVAALASILGNGINYGALLAVAIARFADQK
jgi:hypothetical protein